MKHRWYCNPDMFLTVQTVIERPTELRDTLPKLETYTVYTSCKGQKGGYPVSGGENAYRPDGWHKPGCFAKTQNYSDLPKPPQDPQWPGGEKRGRHATGHSCRHIDPETRRCQLPIYHKDPHQT